jgi:hypothetical protein
MLTHDTSLAKSPAFSLAWSGDVGAGFLPGRFQLGNLRLTRLARHRLALPLAARLVALGPRCIEGMICCLAIGPCRGLVGGLVIQRRSFIKKVKMPLARGNSVVHNLAEVNAAIGEMLRRLNEERPIRRTEVRESDDIHNSVRAFIRDRSKAEREWSRTSSPWAKAGCSRSTYYRRKHRTATD